MNPKGHLLSVSRWLAIPTAVLLCHIAVPASGIGQETFGIPAGSYEDARGVLDRAPRGDEGERARPLGRQPTELTGRERRRADRQAFDFMAFGERFVKDNQDRLAGLSKLEQAKEAYRVYLTFLDSRDAPVSESWLDRFYDLFRPSHLILHCDQHYWNMIALFRGMGLDELKVQTVGNITAENQSSLKTFGGNDVYMANHTAVWFRDTDGKLWVFDPWAHGMINKHAGKRPYTGDPDIIFPVMAVEEWVNHWITTGPFTNLLPTGGLDIDFLSTLAPVTDHTKSCGRCQGKGFIEMEGVDDFGTPQKTISRCKDCRGRGWVYHRGLEGIRVLDAPGNARIIPRDPTSHSGLATGSQIMGGSGAWIHGEGAQAAWADRQQVDRPVILGPFAITPGVYSAHLSFDPPLAPGMTAGNVNTGMSVVFAPLWAPEAFAGGATSISVNMDGKTRGRSAEFTISQPGQIWVTFSPATSWGHAGGRRYPPQSYEGRVSLAKHLAELRAFRGMELHPGDTLRAGSSAVVAQGGGVMMVLQPGAELRVDRRRDGEGLCAERLRGEIRFWATGWSPQGVEFKDGNRTIRVKGTDFVLKESGVEVISGRVELSGEGETVTLQAGQKLDYRTGRVEQFDDAAGLGPALAADGIPADPGYWFEPSPEPFGKKTLSMAGGVLDDGWLLADPPARRGSRVEVESPASGVLRVTAPSDSALACGHYAADTAPRLLHRATGDFDLQALVTMEGQPGYGANLGFLVRAPDAYPGLVATRTYGQRGGDFALPRGVGRSYWRPGDGVAMLGGSTRLPLLNTGSGSWVAAGDAPVRVRLSRRQDVWTTAWSRDGDDWQISTVHVADLPETLWVGWSFENYSFGRGHGPVAFTLRDVILQTSPADTLDWNWGLLAQHGTAQTTGASVHLSLDGGGVGTARAFSPDYAEGDFDVAVTVDAPLSALPPGDHVRGWSVVVASNVEQTVGLMCEVRQQGARYGLTRDDSPGYRAPVVDHWIPDSHLAGATDNHPFRVRLRRTDGRVSAYFWSEGEWKPARPDHPGRPLEGAVFLRFEAYNGDAKTNVLAPKNVTFTVEASGGVSVASPTTHPLPSDEGHREHEDEAAPHGVNVPADAVRVIRLLDGRPRSIGLRVASGASDEALARGMEAPVGVVVTQVAPSSAAAAAGLRVGDQIAQIGDRKLENTEDFEAALFTAKPDSRQSVAFVRGQQRGSVQVPIVSGDPRVFAFHSYTALGGGYQFDYFPQWKLAPAPRREEVTGRVYDYLESTEDNYRLYLYADFEQTANAVECLEAFRRQVGEGFLHGKSGWVLFGDIPAVFASGVVGRERLFTLYRLGFVVDMRRYEMNLFTPPGNDPAKLPFVMEAILGTLRRPDPARPAEARPTPRPPSKPASMPSVAAIEQLRKKAVEVWSPPVDVGADEDFQFPAEDPEPAPAGWAKSEYDPTKLVDLFKPLRLKKGYVLRAYIFRENGNANGVVWAMPEDAEFPEPEDSPTLEHHLFKAPKPWDALDDVMEAIEGDGSAWSYLAASVLRRELREFGASWHGIEWGTHCMLEDDPWKKGPPQEDDFPPSRPTTPASQWKWSAPRPQQWAPTVHTGPDRVTVTFYTFTGKAPEKIHRHTETYRPGRYRARVEDQLIGQGKGGFLF